MASQEGSGGLAAGSPSARAQGEGGQGPLRVGLIGLGIMGRPMARNLLRKGFPLTVWNRTRSRVEELAAEGAQPAASAAEVAARSDVVITIVSDSPDVEQVVLGPGGVLAGARPGMVLVEMSTIAPAISRRIGAKLAEVGAQMLDAPVTGGERGAIEGSLTIMVGGEAEVLERCRPVLEAVGRRIVHVGPLGTGHTAKLCNQVICGLNILAVAEGLALGARAGLDLHKLLEVVTGGSASSWMLSNLGPKMVARDFSPGFRVRLQQKDLRLALEAAADAQLPLPGTALVHQLFRAVEAAGAGDEGTQALLKAIERLGQFVVGSDAE